jgi:peptidoglycan/LPS O-acetylase OafA/YrhL
MATTIEKTAFKDTTASVLLDLLRGLAALLVLLEHWRNLLFIDYPQLTAHKLILILPYALSSAGHQAVVIFFVLSGYLISGSVFRMLERGQWSWKAYLTHRIVRLWVVLIPGLLLCTLWDHLGLHSHLAPLLYSGRVGNHLTGDIHHTLSAHIFFGNLFFLQTLLVPIFGSDSPLWSLANEFWYYLLFPLGLVALRRQFALPQRIVSALLFLGIAWFVRGGILLLFPIWLFGTVLALVPPPRLGNRTRILAAILYSPLAFIFAKEHGIPGAGGDYLFGIATFAFLWVMLSATGRADGRALFTRLSRSLARSSYTLYVVHVPFVILLTALFLGDQRWVPNAPHILKGLGILAIAMLYAYLVASVTEFNTDSIRRWIEIKLGLVRKPIREKQQTRA